MQDIQIDSPRPVRQVIIGKTFYLAECAPQGLWLSACCGPLMAEWCDLQLTGDLDSFVTNAIAIVIPGLDRETIDLLPADVAQRLLTALGWVTAWKFDASQTSVPA